ncbi:heme/copper-type cytochrome/quinol oxidase subunit 2 [Paenibacillus amylolyticus]|uniref:Heme/copper-type cytochrome/quinol oxidase subunit 2 n=1 Tax=Paenibacillus amylolyticus TaxID=1451 RepID=A0AAP5H9W0_PAEAM|nr:hypothetical protein [Paenibacillus amylolyticus]MDR6727438.1 heme/copper-type cytochrome/quinol oxidase subunit 2 [Paenibacillus amylolyticus]
MKEYYYEKFKWFSLIFSIVLSCMITITTFNPSEYLDNEYVRGSLICSFMVFIFVIAFFVFKYLVVYPSTSVRFRFFNVIIDLGLIYFSFLLISINSIQFHINWIEDTGYTFLLIEFFGMLLFSLLFLYYNFFMVMNKLHPKKNKSHINSNRLIKMFICFSVFTILLVLLFTYYGMMFDGIIGDKLLQFIDEQKNEVDPGFWERFYFHFVIYMGLGSSDLIAVDPIMKIIVVLELMVSFINTTLFLVIILDKNINFVPLPKSKNEKVFKQLFFVIFLIIVITTILVYIFNHLKPAWASSM